MKSLRRNTELEQTQDALKHLHECEYEGSGAAATAESLAGAIGCTRDEAVNLLNKMTSEHLCEYTDGAVRLSREGRDEARRVIRAHRLYETFLATKTGTPAAEWHAKADRAEHLLGKVGADKLAGDLGHPRFDPHGDPIPTKTGSLPELRGSLLTQFHPPCRARVLHVGDEPESLGRRLSDHGIAPGALLRLDSLRPDGSIEIFLEGRSVVITAPEAALIRAEMVTEADWETQESIIPLSRLREGEAAIVSGLSASCRGTERSRLLDLGFVRGSRVEADMASPFGSPMAYRIRGTLIALRNSQADAVLVTRIGEK